MLFELLKIRKSKRKSRGEANKVKLLVAIEKDVLRDLSRLKPRTVTRQEAIRQILEYYINERNLFG